MFAFVPSALRTFFSMVKRTKEVVARDPVIDAGSETERVVCVVLVVGTEVVGVVIVSDGDKSGGGGGSGGASSTTLYTAHDDH